jgi:hypothetical protein
MSKQTAEIKALILTIIIIAITFSLVYFGGAMYFLYSLLGIVFITFIYLMVLAIINTIK